MSFVVTCQSCRGKVSAPDTADVRFAACPKCGARIDIPQAEEVTFKPHSSEEKQSSNGPFRRTCPHCKATVAILRESIGQLVECANCHEQFRAEAKTSEPDRDFILDKVEPALRSSVATLRRNIQKTPPVLRAMKIATLLWIAAMLANGTLIFASKFHGPIEISDGLYLKNNLGMALSTALFGAPILPTYFYVPTMIVLFVFWFADRESQKQNGSSN